MTTADPENLLRELAAWGRKPDADIDLAEVALIFGALNHPGISLERYRHHLSKLSLDTGIRHREMLAAGATDDATTRVDALRRVFIDEQGYQGDSETYNDLQNADLIRVIDRRKGMPIALAILIIHIARAQGWTAHGLNFPGHFVVRIDKEGERLIIDAFRGCAILQAADLRRIIKETLGPQAELSTTYYEPVPTRAILVRLQNNVKIRQIEAEDYEGALRTVETLRVLDPDEYRLLLDAGVLYARTRRLEAAITTLEDYIKLAPDDRDRHEAALLLQQIRQLLA